MELPKEGLEVCSVFSAPRIPETGGARGYVEGTEFATLRGGRKIPLEHDALHSAESP